MLPETNARTDNFKHRLLSQDVISESSSVASSESSASKLSKPISMDKFYLKALERCSTGGNKDRANHKIFSGSSNFSSAQISGPVNNSLTQRGKSSKRPVLQKPIS